MDQWSLLPLRKGNLLLAAATPRHVESPLISCQAHPGRSPMQPLHVLNAPPCQEACSQETLTSERMYLDETQTQSLLWRGLLLLQEPPRGPRSVASVCQSATEALVPSAAPAGRGWAHYQQHCVLRFPEAGRGPSWWNCSASV